MKISVICIKNNKSVKCVGFVVFSVVYVLSNSVINRLYSIEDYNSFLV